jgi:type II secretory pathway pseudopilin PulG
MMQELKPFKSEAGSARVISMVVLVVILVCGYVALDFYTGGQQNASMVEGRGGAIVGALSGYKRETGSLPDTLEKLVPKYLPALAKCPNGQPYGYKPAGQEYTLTCQEVLFKSKPYQYDSKSRAWAG